VNIAVMKAKRLKQLIIFRNSRAVIGGAERVEEFAEAAGLATHVILPFVLAFERTMLITV
jgi:hypothetical protein